VARFKPSKSGSWFAPPKDGYRSVNLKLDYGNPEIVSEYLLTHKSADVLEKIIASTENESRDRANSIIAPYGSGKSSLLLVLSALLENRKPMQKVLAKVQNHFSLLTPTLAKNVGRLRKEKNEYIVVILSGDEGSLELAFRLGLKEAFERRGLNKLWKKITATDQGGAAPSNDSYDGTIDIYKKAAEGLRAAGYKGIFVLHDEFGKVLEGQQINPRPGDLFFLQSFAELCSRSGKRQIHLCLSLHQGFSQYAHRLPVYVRNEWAKIEGRFRTFNYVEDSLQVYSLIGHAVKKLRNQNFKGAVPEIKKIIKPYAKVIRSIPAFRSLGSPKHIEQLLEDVFPLDPIALYVLPRLSARVAQNERTLFHFILGQERDCLFPIIDRSGAESLSLVHGANLFEYFSDLMQRDTGVGGVYRRYGEIATALGRLAPEDDLAQSLIKAIGIINIINEPSKLPTTLEVIEWALGAFRAPERQRLHAVLDRLVQAKILLFRRHNQEYRIWEGSDIDLNGLLRQKKAEYESHFRPSAVLASKISAPYTLPHRYNEVHGMVRYFEGMFSSVDEIRHLEWDETLGNFPRIDGRIYYVLAENQPEIDAAIELAQKQQNSQIVFAIPRYPLNISEPLLELQCLEMLLADSAFVAHDPILQRELSELADDCLSAVQRKLMRLMEPRYRETIWVYSGERREEVTSQAALQRLVSEICAKVFPSTPTFHNELINRRQPSATIVNARKKLLRAILDRNGAEQLGLTGFGPDVSMFRAVLAPGLYQEIQKGRWAFVGSEQIKNVQVKRVVKAIEDYLFECSAQPRPMSSLISQLVSPPLGLREGVLPILFAAVFQAFPLPLNVMVDGVFVKELKAETFERMLLAPEKVAIQCVKLGDEISQYLVGLEMLFTPGKVQSSDFRSQRELLHYALESIYRWIHQLPSCTMTTQQLSSTSITLRTTLVKATDPVALVLREIPEIYVSGQEFKTGETVDWMTAEQRQIILGGLKGTIDELNAFKTQLRKQVEKVFRKHFADNGKDPKSLIEVLRTWLSNLTNNIREYLDDPQCSGFVARVQSNYETDETMVESLASLVTGRSITYWDDSFLRQFELGLLGIKKRIRDTNDLLVKRDGTTLPISPHEWTVRIERGGRPSAEWVMSDLTIRDDLLTVKSRVEKIFEELAQSLTSEERQRVLLELLKEGL
jgi:hypothetical protein